MLRAHWLRVTAMGALGFTGFNALFYVAGHYTSAVNLALIQASIPALVLVGSSAAFRVHGSSFAWIGAIVTMVASRSSRRTATGRFLPTKN